MLPCSAVAVGTLRAVAFSTLDVVARVRRETERHTCLYNSRREQLEGLVSQPIAIVAPQPAVIGALHDFARVL